MAAYDLLGEVYIEKGEFNKALYYEIKYQKGIELAGDTATAGNAYVRLAYIYGYLRNYPSALEWAKKSLSNLIATNELDNLFYTSNTIVVAYINARRPVEALKFLSAMTAKYKPVKPRDREYVQFSFGNIYKALKNYPMAEKSYLEMVKLIDTRVNAGDNIDKADEYEAIGNFYLDRKKYAPAQQYLETSLKYLGKKGLLGMLERVHLSLFKVDSALGDYKSAIRQLRLNNKIRDSIFNTARDNQVEEMNIQYQTQEKEKDIKLAQAKDKLEQAQLERTQNGRNWIVAGLGLLLIIAGLLYRQSRLRKNNNQLITQKNELLQKLLAEKEWLLKEVHHRVKNNLHTVICLLESQARYLENDALKAIESSQHRIYAMSLIHQKLYQSDDIKTIDMAIYIPELVKSLEDSFDVSNQIQFKLNVQRVNLDISHAIPLGLIINEAITNSIKYAFPNNRKGEISVLMLNNNDRIKLVLADNGIGMPPINFDVESESLGLRLMKGLSEDIDAIISFEVDKGTRIKVVFNVDLLNTSNNPFVNLKEGGIYE